MTIEITEEWIEGVKADLLKCRKSTLNAALRELKAMRDKEHEIQKLMALDAAARYLEDVLNLF
jgi:hypothetical protein